MPAQDARPPGQLELAFLLRALDQLLERRTWLGRGAWQAGNRNQHRGERTGHGGETAPIKNRIHNHSPFYLLSFALFRRRIEPTDLVHAGIQVDDVAFLANDPERIGARRNCLEPILEHAPELDDPM